MCYPADYGKDGGFIPQWVLWYVLEVGEYLTVRAKGADREPFRRSVLSAMDLFARYENGDGLLERLPGWNFVEWSDANKWCRDVNYPTNFLYSAALDTAAELYSLPELHEKAERVRTLTAERAFNGEVFVDNAQRGADGALVNTENVSEAGQYYAAIFGKIDLADKKYARLAEYIENGFEGYEERSGKLCRINAFIGLYLRVMLLHGLGNGKALRKTVVEHCLPMARATGTLWENKDTRGSLNHGFASYLATALPLADECEV
jgi:alpha-L-rhamnosidase